MGLRLAIVSILACAIACGGASTAEDSSPPPRDLAGGSSSDGSDGCGASLAAWCARPDQTWERCVATLTAATQATTWSTWCGSGGGAATIAQESCGSYTVVAQADADVSTQYVYDSGGALVAVFEFGYQGTPACVAGPSSFAYPPCPAIFTRVCP
jgi:hypothetical protein